MAAELPPRLDDQACFWLYSANIAMLRLCKPALDSVGLTFPQYLVLSAVWEKDGQTIGALADRLSLELSTITPLVKRLEAAEFVVRRRNPADERQVGVWLAARGSALRTHAPQLNDILQQSSGLNTKELASLNEALRSLCGAIAQTLNRL